MGSLSRKTAIWCLTAIAAAPLSLIGCGVRGDTTVASHAIDRFHEELNAGDFGSIYDGSSSDLKKSVAKPAFEQGFWQVRQKSGLFRSGHIEKLTDRVSTRGHFIDVDYSATYQNGSAEEHFEFHYDDGQPTLAIYRVDSQGTAG